MDHKCANCKQSNCSLRCSACHLIYYCNRSCQETHWKAFHKRDCKKRSKKSKEPSKIAKNNTPVLSSVTQSSVSPIMAPSKSTTTKQVETKHNRDLKKDKQNSNTNTTKRTQTTKSNSSLRHQQPWVACAVTGKGMGLVATRDIPAATHLIKEKPLLCQYRRQTSLTQHEMKIQLFKQFARLSKLEMKAILSLFSVKYGSLTFGSIERVFRGQRGKNKTRIARSCVVLIEMDEKEESKINDNPKITTDEKNKNKNIGSNCNNDKKSDENKNKNKNTRNDSNSDNTTNKNKVEVLLIEVIWEIYQSNAIDTLDSSSPLISGLYPKVSRVNHSCMPNCCWLYNKSIGKLILFALKDMSQGDELTCRYTRVATKFDDRIKFLTDNYGFICNCDECTQCRQNENYQKTKDIAATVLDKSITRMKTAKNGDFQASIQVIKMLDTYFESFPVLRSQANWYAAQSLILESKYDLAYEYLIRSINSDFAYFGEQYNWDTTLQLVSCLPKKYQVLLKKDAIAKQIFK